MGQRRRMPSRRPYWWVGVAVASVLVLAGVVVGWALNPSQPSPGPPGPDHATADGLGLVAGDGPVPVEIWFELGCPDCHEAAKLVDAVDELDQLVDGDVATRVYRPIARDLDAVGLSASIACAADHGTHSAYLAALVAIPSADGPPSYDELIHLAGGAGLIDPAFARCVRGEQYRDWAHRVAAHATTEQVAGLPAVRVAGAEVQALPAVVTSAVVAAAKGPAAR